MDKEELIKEIRADMRNLKNQWVFKRYDTKDFYIETKRFDNWFQIFRINSLNFDDNKKASPHFAMEMTQKAVIKQIEESLKDF